LTITQNNGSKHNMHLTRQERFSLTVLLLILILATAGWLIF
jgi:hypothetical protein